MKKSFILYLDTLDIAEKLTDEQLGQFFRAIINYQKEKNYELPFELELVFDLFKKQFIRDEQKYSEFLKKQSANGKKGGRPKLTQPFFSKPKKANPFLENPKKPNSVNVNDNVSVSVNDSNNNFEKKNFIPTTTGKVGGKNLKIFKKLVKWFSGMDDVVLPQKLAEKYFSLYPVEIIRKALNHSACVSRQKFATICNDLKRKN